MGEDPEQLEREIQATRAKLGEDIDALEEKVNPRKVAQRSVESAKEKLAEAKEKVASKTAEAKEKVAAAKEKTAAGQSGAPSQNGLGQKAADLAGTVKGKAQPLVDKAAPAAQQVKDKAAIRAGLDPATANTRQVATTLAGDTWATLQEQTRRNPALVGAVAFALGFLLGR